MDLIPLLQPSQSFSRQFLIAQLKNPKIGGDTERRDHAGPREMSSPVRVGTYVPITSKITPVLFLPVRGIVQNLHVCRRPTPPTKRNTARNKKAGDARKASEWITEDVTCSWRNSRRAISLISADVSTRSLDGLGSIENLKMKREKEKSLKYVRFSIRIAKYYRLWIFFYLISIGMDNRNDSR